ncbi:hypothetical protein M885DRAFT_521509 [Pelagophyceae sp. CCMP2097]|nr:hypothetical protein M885DRAFT_521509 [Pelagophyceae sp. CCMP2097]
MSRRGWLYDFIRRMSYAMYYFATSPFRVASWLIRTVYRMVYPLNTRRRSAVQLTVCRSSTQSIQHVGRRPLRIGIWRPRMFSQMVGGVAVTVLVFALFLADKAERQLCIGGIDICRDFCRNDNRRYFIDICRDYRENRRYLLDSTQSDARKYHVFRHFAI